MFSWHERQQWRLSFIKACIPWKVIFIEVLLWSEAAYNLWCIQSKAASHLGLISIERCQGPPLNQRLFSYVILTFIHVSLVCYLSSWLDYTVVAMKARLPLCLLALWAKAGVSQLVQTCVQDNVCYQGSAKVTNNGRNFESYQGIPYASPPIGDLRSPSELISFRLFFNTQVQVSWAIPV